MTNETPTPAATLSAATHQGALPLRDVTLVGTMHGPSSARAWVRLYDGNVVGIKIGDGLDQSTVAAIGEGVIVLSLDGQTETLRLPVA